MVTGKRVPVGTTPVLLATGSGMVTEVALEKDTSSDLWLGGDDQVAVLDGFGLSLSSFIVRLGQGEELWGVKEATPAMNVDVLETLHLGVCG